MANNSAPVKLISECFIRPKYEQPNQQQPYYLSHTDLSLLASHYLQKGLLFNKPNNLNIYTLLEKLKDAIALTLVHYYPLSGNFVIDNCDDNDKDDDCWMYLDSNKGPSVRFIHAVCSVATVADVVESNPDFIPIIRGFFELGEGHFINYDGHTRPLLCVQVTELSDGVFIGFSMNHSVVDGATFWNFVNSLSEIFNSIDTSSTIKGNLSTSKIPIIKQIFADGYGRIIKLSSSKLNELTTHFRVEVDPHLRERIFHFSSSSIAKLKAEANAEYCCDGSVPQISSFKSLGALIWRSIIRARALDPNSLTTCTLVANTRTRFDPPLPLNQFGNFIIPIQASSKVGDMLKNSLGWVAMVIHQAIVSVDNDQKSVCDRCKNIFEIMFGKSLELRTSIVGGDGVVVIGGSVRFNMYGSEFGLGKSIAVRTGYAAKTDGKVTANPGCDGEGSVELEISLPLQTMRALEKDQEFMSFVTHSGITNG